MQGCIQNKTGSNALNEIVSIKKKEKTIVCGRYLILSWITTKFSEDFNTPQFLIFMANIFTFISEPLCS